MYIAKDSSSAPGNFADRCRLKIHLHRWIIIKACYYIRNMKLKRPSGATDYETLADLEGEPGVSADFTSGHMIKLLNGVC